MKKLQVLFLLVFLSAISVQALTLETKYFNLIYDRPDEFYANRISQSMDDIYERINRDMGLVPKGRIDIYLCRTEEQFESIYGGKPAEQIVAFAQTRPKRLVAIKSPYIARRINLESVLAQGKRYPALVERRICHVRIARDEDQSLCHCGLGRDTGGSFEIRSAGLCILR